MNKNQKSFLFLAISLLILLISLSSVCAEDTNNTNTQDISVYHDSSISEYSTPTTIDKSKIETKNKDNINDKKTTDKQKKEAVEPTTTVDNYETLKTTWNNIKTSEDNTTDYIINVKNGNYKFNEELEINTTSNIKSITINGEDPDKTIFDGANTTRHFNLNTTTLKVNFNNITFANGFNNNTGGSIYSKAVTSINNSKFINNTVIPSKSSTRCYGGAIKLENNFTITYSLFENNTMIGSYGYGGALSITTNVIGDITNCKFINNEAKCGTIYPGSTKNNITLQRCVIYDKKPYYGTKSKVAPYNLSYNWYGFNSSEYGEDFILLVNNQTNFNILNQKNSTVTIQLYKYESSNIYPFSNISIGLKPLKISSSSDLINTTDIALSAKNNYTAVIDISKLPAKHEDITLYMDNLEVAKVVYNYTNIELNDITAKPGETITIKTKLTTNNNELVQDGKVAFKINGCTIGHKNVKVGVVLFNYTIPENYSAKDYTLSIVYGSSNEFIEARKNATLKLNKITTSTNLTTSIEGNTLKITVDPKDEKGNTVKNGKICVKIQGKTLQNLKIKGKTTVNFTIPKSWNNREIKVLAIYGENNNHKESRMEIKTKLILPSTKTTKTDETINNYYVSDLAGSDTNTGSQTSPFKTIQKAITTIQANNQKANIYLDGQFKGVGNTNLTVPGNLYINFIGIGNSSIDGEVNYTLSSGTGVWGASLEWEPYNNGRGNWAMNITKGTGLITINNLTIKNCWNSGGANIALYETATVDNYGNLAVNNVTFYFNHGGVGASIRNNNGSNLNVTNSLFEANRKSSSTGNFGAGVYNNGTATIINSIFQKNYARWGTITNDKNLTIINSTIQDNIAYDGASTYKTGSGITINSGETDFFDPRIITGVITVVDGCYFTNNDQLDIYIHEGNTNITNCVLNKSTGIRGATKSDKNVIHIINNTIINPQPSTLATTLSSSNLEKYALYLAGGPSYLIENNTGINLTCYAIESSNNIYSTPTQNSIIRNNTFDNSIYLNGGNNNIIENNNITTKQEYAIYLYTQSNTKVTGNYLKSSQFEGDGSVSYQGSTTLVANNTPKMALIRLNEENFYQYFDDDGNLKPDYDYIDQIILIDALKDKTMIFNQTIKIGQQDKRTLSNNITIIMNNEFVNTTGLKILNTNNQPVFILNTDNNIITGSELTTNNTNTIIINNTKNNTITGNILIADLLVGDESVKTTTADADNITGNTPLYKNYLIDDTTYDTYFNNDGTIKPLSEDRSIRWLIGDLNNKILNFNNNEAITLMNYHEIVAHNITIKTEGNTTLSMTSITITNTNRKPVLEIRGLSSTITYTTLTSNDNVILFENTKDITLENNNIIANVTNDVKAITIKNVENLRSLFNNIMITANITPDNNTHTIVAIDGTNLTKADLYRVNINIVSINEANDNIYAFNIINPKIYDTALANSIRTCNIQIKGYNNICALNMTNQSLDIIENNIEVSAKNTIIINATTSNATRNLGGIDDNNMTMNSQMNNTGIILNSCENMAIRDSNFINMMSENITAIQLNNSTNIKLLRIVMNLNGNNIVAININDTSKINMTLCNITVNSKNINQAPILQYNAEETSITNNNILTTTEYAIKICEKSSGIIKNNNLYALKTGDESVLKETSNYIKIMDNYPVKSYKNLLLNDYTYDGFFDEYGVLRDEVSSGSNITINGNLNNKVLNITRPVNILGNDLLSFINTTFIINTKNTNITNIHMNGYDNTKLIINANNCNINISTINMQNSRNENITLITLNGNNNNITLTSIITTNQENNANITLFKMTGKQNNIAIGSMKATNFNNSTAILIDNSNKNMIQFSSIESINGMILNNSNQNMINFGTTSTKLNGLIITNSSNNIITQNGHLNCLNKDGKLIIIENNSNNNKFLGIYTNYGFNKAPIIIKNSNNNLISGGRMTLEGNTDYAIEIIGGENNIIKNNVIRTEKYRGDLAVYQEYDKTEKGKNIILSNNYQGTPFSISIYVNDDDIKVGNTITIRGICNYNFKNQGGFYTYYINGKEIGTVESDDTPSYYYGSINYTITGNEGEKLIIDVVYFGGNYTTAAGHRTAIYSITKLDSKILLPTVVNNGKMTNVTAFILDENGNIIYNGKVAFKVDQKTVGVVNITNGIAQISIDTSIYKCGNHEIYAVYGGNNQCTKSNTTTTLTIEKYDVKVDVKPVTTNPGSKTTFKATITDMSNDSINTGKVVFKLNGKTLKDDEGNTIIAEVKNGTATIEYMIPSNYSTKDYILTAVASDNKYNRTETNTTLTIVKPTA